MVLLKMIAIVMGSASKTRSMAPWSKNQECNHPNEEKAKRRRERSEWRIGGHLEQ